MNRALLRVTAPHFVAGAVWQKCGDEWLCEHAAPVIQYMQNMTAAQAASHLQRKRWTFEWFRL